MPIALQWREMKTFSYDKSYGRLHVVQDGGHIFVSSSLLPSASASDVEQLFSDSARAMNDAGAVPVHERLFGSVTAASAAVAARARAFGAAGISVDMPFTWVEGKPQSGAGFAGCLLHGIVPDGDLFAPVLVSDNDAVVGRRWRSKRAEYMMLQGVGSTGNAMVSPSDQAAEIFKRADCILRQEGFSFRDVVRTWFYLKDILDWYDAFNRVRSHAYTRFGIMPSPGSHLLLPASTGIEGVGIRGAAAMTDIFLVRPVQGEAPERLLNPSQKEAFQYGSAFSRAVRITEGEVSLIEISGTAAIDETGASLYPDDAEAQVSCTLDKIEALLGGVHATLRDIVSATVFVKHAKVADAFNAAKQRRGLDHFPAVIVRADVCRADLLFEIDAEALVR